MGKQRFTEADLQFARGLLQGGAPPEAVHAELVERGCLPRVADAILGELFFQSVSAAVDNLPNAKESMLPAPRVEACSVPVRWPRGAGSIDSC